MAKNRNIFRISKGKTENTALVGFPDLVENIDILSSLYGAEYLLMDMLMDPEWVK